MGKIRFEFSRLQVEWGSKYILILTIKLFVNNFNYKNVNFHS